MKRQKRILSIVVIILMVFAMMPMTADIAYADENTEYTVVLDPGAIGGDTITVKSTDEGMLVPWEAVPQNGQFQWGSPNMWYRYPDLPAAFAAPSGAEFLGWTSSAVSSIQSPGFMCTVSEDTLTLTAQWSKVDVSFNSNGGNGEMDSASVVKGKEYTIPECAFTAPTGKVFWGWNTVAEGTAGNYGEWYYPGEKVALTSDITLYARWSDPALSVCSYDSTSSKSSQGGKYIFEEAPSIYERRWSRGCDNYTARMGDAFTVKAAPDNGYKFLGWYKGKYIHKDDQGNPVQDAEPYMDQLLTTAAEYSFEISDSTVLCPVFEAPQVSFIDIGNVWRWLDPVNATPFTGEVNPNEEGLINLIELTEETWTSSDGESVISSADPGGIPTVGKTYRYAAKITAKTNNVFDPDAGFRFIYGGTEYAYDDLDVTFSADNKTATISGFEPDQTVNAVDVKDATVSGITAKAYNGKAQTQNPAVKITVNGTEVALKNGADYTIAYKNNVNAGTATVTVNGKDRFTGSISKTFKINKAANTLAVSAKTAKVKYSKLKKKAQKLDISKVINFTNKGQGTLSYKLVSAKKGKKSFKKYFKIDAKTGKVTIKKKLKKGTYQVQVQIKAAGNANYNQSAWKPVTFKVKVK